MRWGSAGLALLLTMGACAPAVKNSPGEAAASHEARQVLDLTIGVEPDQPGFAPGRVGGVPDRGPLAVAADGSSIFLADQAKGRILQYENGQLSRIIPTPWMEEQAVNLYLVPEGIEVRGPYERFTIDLTGRILEAERRYAPEEEQVRFTAADLGTDRFGNHYTRGITAEGTQCQRVAPDGQVLAEGLLGPADAKGEMADWFLTEDGGLYVLFWLEWPAVNTGVRVYEVLPPVAEAKGNDGPSEPPADPTAPTFKGYPVPTEIRLFSPNWAPYLITREVDLWNVWQLLASSARTDAEPPRGESLLAQLEVTLPGPDYVAVDLYPSYAVIEGERYVLNHAEALRALLGAMQHSSLGLTEALGAASEIWVESPDLPGASLRLSREQVAELALLLQQAYPVNRYTPPQPLEAPFPRYRLSLGAQAWIGQMELRGDYLLPERNTLPATAAYVSGISELVSRWLPVPDLPDGSVYDLFLAERLEIGEGVDLTRWKNTVVRHLLGKEQHYGEVVNQEPFTLTFYVQGEPRVVQVDTEGFTYGGKRFEGSRLTDLVQLQGVP